MIEKDEEYPWMFHRDEVDLLEDEIEDLYERFQDEDKEFPSFESAILAEQLETEEDSDKILADRLGTNLFDEIPDVFEVLRSQEPFSTSRPLQQEGLSIRSHPLYQAGKKWADLVKPIARAGYEDGHVYEEAFFRVFANINFVPLKIFMALSEEMHEDQMGLVIAEEEYRLAVLYIDRILESLSLMAFSQELFEWLTSVRRQAEGLSSALNEHRSSLHGRNSRSV
ncbi:hypothetical protein HQ487_02160 [Candidatus Uhrbacteria bacterium]|nr:hypothetical protein [Candidatus Uhrbacteria bacterium]